jgi:tetratricopeptide (TPR) repeat protein
MDRLSGRGVVLLLSVMAAAPFGSGQQSSASSNQVEAPSNAAASLAQLRQMIDRGQSSEALKRLDQLKVQPSPPSGIDRLRGLALYAQSRFAEADSAFATAIRTDPHDEEATQMRGLTLFRLGKPAEAIPLLEAAHQWTSETKYDPNYVLALCYIDTRRYDDARHAFAAQYGFAPDSAPAYLVTARMLFRREYLSTSQEFAAKALQLEPGLPLAHGLLGEISLALDHPDMAVMEFEKERALNPLEGGTYERLGDAYTRTGDYAKAERVLQQALLLEPNATGPYILLGKVLLRQEDPVNAALYLERARGMDPQNTMTHTLLAQSYRAMGRADDASREMQLVQKLQSQKESPAEPHR